MESKNSDGGVAQTRDAGSPADSMVGSPKAPDMNHMAPKKPPHDDSRGSQNRVDGRRSKPKAAGRNPVTTRATIALTREDVEDVKSRFMQAGWSQREEWNRQIGVEIKGHRGLTRRLGIVYASQLFNPAGTVSRKDHEALQKIYDRMIKMFPQTKREIDAANKNFHDVVYKSRVVYRGSRITEIESMIRHDGEVGHHSRENYTESELDYIPASLNKNRVVIQFWPYGGALMEYDISEMEPRKDFMPVTYTKQGTITGIMKEGGPRRYRYGETYGGMFPGDISDELEVQLRRGTRPIVRSVRVDSYITDDGLKTIQRLVDTLGYPVSLEEQMPNQRKRSRTWTRVLNPGGRVVEERAEQMKRWNDSS